MQNLSERSQSESANERRCWWLWRWWEVQAPVLVTGSPVPEFSPVVLFIQFRSSLSVWDFFTGNSIEKTAMCILCNMVLKVQPNSGVWNLKRHVSRLHPREFERYSKKMNPAGSQQSVIWNCFTKSWEERTAVCKMCGLMFDCNVKPTMKMKQHLLQSHRDCVIDTVVKKEQ
ncbi:hypothetical protein RUM43_003110 [Polyplax serrata]|uniref:BED-type domain-containing protein n=1 Tax=Polyplax serrata TaxID=468196 RepID=A0AAN8PDY6_POLSC